MEYYYHTLSKNLEAFTEKVQEKELIYIGKCDDESEATSKLKQKTQDLCEVNDEILRSQGRNTQYSNVDWYNDWSSSQDIELLFELYDYQIKLNGKIAKTPVHSMEDIIDELYGNFRMSNEETFIDYLNRYEPCLSMTWDDWFQKYGLSDFTGSFYEYLKIRYEV